MKPTTSTLLLIICWMTPYAKAQTGTVFISQPHQVIKLTDLNADGDFFDFAEHTIFADTLPADLNGITIRDRLLFVGASQNAEVFVLEDRNGDDDALDVAEVLLYGRLPNADPSPRLTGIASQSDGAVFAANGVDGTLHIFRDVNNDGDALDTGETLMVAENLISPVAVAVRSDHILLVAQADHDVPIRILEDRNADGDFLDFAENLSYAEDIIPGDALSILDTRRSFLVRSTTGEIIQLRDLTEDNDALDFAEVIPHALGLDNPKVGSLDSEGGLYVAADDAAGTVYLVRDFNGDGDALDFGEVLPVADGIGQPLGIVFVPETPMGCIKGDINNDTVIDSDDIFLFVDILLDNTVPSELCRADVNDDGEINGKDVQFFLNQMI